MNVLAFNPTEIAEPPEERVDLQISRRGEEKANAGDPLHLLGARHHR
jgi:hypothetical protein